MARLLVAICLALTSISVEFSGFPAHASAHGLARTFAASSDRSVTSLQPQTMTTTLYDQTSGVGTIGTRSDNTTDLNHVSYAADDFTVPAGTTWTVTEVDTLGVFNPNGGCSSAPPSSVNVFIYADNGGLPASSPSFSYTDLTPTGGTSNPNFDIPITATQLSAGTWWVSVQANITCGSQEQWFWMDRSPQAGNAAAWKSNFDCSTWTVRSSCENGASDYSGDSSHPDQAFKLLGTSVDTLTITPTPSTRSCTAGSPCGGSIATITDTDSDPCTNYTASITWGDSTASVGAVSGTDASSGCTITATHSYLFPGTYTVVIVVIDTDGTAEITTMTVIVGQASAAGQCWTVTGAATTSGVSFKDKAQDVRTTGGAAGGIYWQDTRTRVTVSMTSVYAVIRSGSVTTIYGTGTITKTGSGSESGVQIREDLYGSGTYPTSVQLRVNGPIPYDSGVLPVTVHTVGVIASC